MTHDLPAQVGSRAIGQAYIGDGRYPSEEHCTLTYSYGSRIHSACVRLFDTPVTSFKNSESQI